MDGEDFSGAKIALTIAGRIVTYRRDDKPDIPFPGLWDLPGGGREGAETPVQCALREVREEFGIALPGERVCWSRRYPSRTSPGLVAYFLAAPIMEDEVAAIRFGEEGERWAMMPAEDYLRHDRAVPHLQRRLTDYLRAAACRDAR